MCAHIPSAVGLAVPLVCAFNLYWEVTLLILTLTGKWQGVAAVQQLPDLLPQLQHGHLHLGSLLTARLLTFPISA